MVTTIHVGSGQSMRTHMKGLRVSSIGILIFSLVRCLVFGQLPDPREILTKSKAAIKSLHSISYHAEYYVVGTLKYGDMDAVLTPKQGDVTFVRISEDRFFGGKLSIQGPSALTKPSAVPKIYKVVYDGQRVVSIGEKERTVFVNEPDQAGKYLLVNVSDLVPAELKEPDPFSNALKSGTIRYAGKAFVGGVACHIVQAGFSGDSSLKEYFWFLGTEDYLPRKIQRVGFGLPNQEIGQVLTLTDLRIDPEVAENQFVVDAPEGYVVTKYQLPDHPNAPGLTVGSPAPAWTLQDSGGKMHSLRDFRGKLVILDFWATWCGPCRQAMPTLQKLSERYGKKGVVIVGINTWESGDAPRFINDNGYSYLLMLNGDAVAKSYRVTGLPTLYIIGPDGNILFGEVGVGSEGSPERYYSKLEEIISSSLKKKKRPDMNGLG